MVIKVGDTYEPVFKLDDLERHMDRDIFEAVQQLAQVEIDDAREDAEMYKEKYEVEERICDERFQIISEGIQSLVALREELKSLQRFNRNQLITRLNDIIGELERY